MNKTVRYLVGATLLAAMLAGVLTMHATSQERSEKYEQLPAVSENQNGTTDNRDSEIERQRIADEINARVQASSEAKARAQAEAAMVETQQVTQRCIDVTSYDYDWSNDMQCTRSDRSIFYTSYSGAEAFLSK